MHRYLAKDCAECPALHICLAYGPPEHEDDADISSTWQHYCNRCKRYELVRLINGPGADYRKINVHVPKLQLCCPYDFMDDHLCWECIEKEITQWSSAKKQVAPS